MKLNPLAKSWLAATEGAAMDITAEQYGAFMVRIFNAWFDDPEPAIYIEPIRQHIARILGVPGVVHACHFSKSCHRSFLGIAPDGEIYPCGMFQGEPAFQYGNNICGALKHVLSEPIVGTVCLDDRDHVCEIEVNRRF